MRAQPVNSFTVAPHPKDKRFVPLEGSTFNRLTVHSYAGGLKWNCVCTCGTQTIIPAGKLKNGETKSCGCLHRDAIQARFTKHGESKSAGNTAEYRIFVGAKHRCTNPDAAAFPSYGGRGIEFRFDSFDHFLDTIGRRPSPKHTLDRIDNNSHYEPGNVRWATWRTQQRNRRDNVMIAIDGVTKCQTEWALEHGLTLKRASSRRSRGWCDTCAVTLPLGESCHHRR